MYNKLVLENKSEEFKITFDWNEHTVPSGKFEAEETLGHFITAQASKWWFDVKRISIPEAPKVTKIEPVIKEVEETEPVEETKKETKEETKTEVKEEKKEEKKTFGYKL